MGETLHLSWCSPSGAIIGLTREAELAPLAAAAGARACELLSLVGPVPGAAAASHLTPGSTGRGGCASCAKS